MGWFFTWECQRCLDPTELGSNISSVACPACPKGGHLLPTHIKVEKEKEEKKRQDELALAKTEDSDSDFDDLLDDLALNPEMFKKKEPEVTEEQINEAGEKFAKAKDTQEGKDKSKSDRWFTDMDGEKGSELDQIPFYAVPWYCTACGMVVVGDQVEALLSKTQEGMPGSKVAKVEDHEKFLTATADLLHPSNFQVVITKRLLSQLYGRGESGMEKLTDEMLARKATLCRELLVTVSKIDPGFSQFRGLTTWELFLARNEMRRRNKEMNVSEEELKELLLIV